MALRTRYHLRPLARVRSPFTFGHCVVSRQEPPDIDTCTSVRTVILEAFLLHRALPESYDNFSHFIPGHLADPDNLWGNDKSPSERTRSSGLVRCKVPGLALIVFRPEYVCIFS